jgi:predicted permease
MAVIKRREQRAGGRAASRNWLGALVAGEIAVAVILLTGGALVFQSFRKLQAIDLGFRPDGLWTVEMALSPGKFPGNREQAAFAERVLERVRAIPGVEAAGTTTNIPLQRVSMDSVFDVEGRPRRNPADVPISALRLVSPGYLETLGVTLLEGRLLEGRDRDGAEPVVVVTEELARQAWPGEKAVGKRVRRWRPQDGAHPWMTVVGVVRDVKEDRFNFRNDRPAWYLPHAQQRARLLPVPLNIVVRTSGDPAAVAAAVKEAIRAIDPDQPISPPRAVADIAAELLAAERFSAALMATLAAVGLALAVFGLYAVLAFSVGQRTGEFGLRMALGARAVDIQKLVLGHGAAVLVIGLAAGWIGARALTHLLSGALYRVRPGDPGIAVLVALVLAAATFAACSVPARRATHIDPIRALRSE